MVARGNRVEQKKCFVFINHLQLPGVSIEYSTNKQQYIKDVQGELKTFIFTSILLWIKLMSKYYNVLFLLSQSENKYGSG